MKYIIFYLALKGNDYVPSYSIALSREDIPRIIQNAKNDCLACHFSVFELGEDVTKEFIDNEE